MREKVDLQFTIYYLPAASSKQPVASRQQPAAVSNQSPLVSTNLCAADKHEIYDNNDNQDNNDNYDNYDNAFSSFSINHYQSLSYPASSIYQNMNYKNQLLEKIAANTEVVGIIGLGYVGLPALPLTPKGGPLHTQIF